MQSKLSTKLQKSIIHACRHARGLSDDDYRAAVLAVSGGRTQTSVDLSLAEADELILKLGGTAPRRTDRTQQRRNQQAGVTLLATSQQLGRLRTAALARWGEHYAQPLAALCRRNIKRDAPVTGKQAQVMIETLKSMARRDAARKQEVAA